MIKKGTDMNINVVVRIALESDGSNIKNGSYIKELLKQRMCCYAPQWSKEMWEEAHPPIIL